MEISLGRVAWLPVIASAFLVAVTQADTHYHLATSDQPCKSYVTEGSTVDLVCRYFDHSDKKRACHMTSIQWQRLGVRRINNISDSYNKVSVWEAVPGVGMTEDEHISLLRIKDVSPKDLATYRCEIHCLDEDNIPYKAHHYINLCLSQEGTNLGICATYIDNEFCSANFRNDICDLDCETERHLFDGFDCADQQQSCPPQFDAYCAKIFSNGVCDQNCNMAPCAWDGGDCVTTPLTLADDDLVVFLPSSGWRGAAGIDLHKDLSRSLSNLLRTIVRVLPYNTQDSPNWSSQFQGLDSAILAHSDRFILKLDNTNCQKDCFRRTERAAQFILAALRGNWEPGIPIEAVAVRSRKEKQCVKQNNTNNILLVRSYPGGGEAVDGQTMEGGSSNNGGSNRRTGLPSWILVASIAGGVCLLVLIIALTLVACRFRSSPDTGSRDYKHPPYQHEITRIREKKGPPGTDV